MQLDLSPMAVLVCPIAKQLKRQGIRAKNVKELKDWQLIAESINQLVMREIIPESRARTGRNKLFKRICNGVVEVKRRKTK